MKERSRIRPRKGSIYDIIEKDGRKVNRLLNALYEAARVGQLFDQKHGFKRKDGCVAARTLLGIFRGLTLSYIHLARGGDRDLILELPLYARQLVEVMEELTPNYSELFAEQARHEVAWPIMAARHYPKESDFRALADLIELGSKAVVNLSPRARYKLDTPINRFLLQLFGGTIATAKEFYVVNLRDDMPKLTPKTLPYYLDEFIMPKLEQIRDNEGSWAGIPAIADIVKRIPYESEHRSAVRNRIKRALKAMAAPER
jgi:hypothetical protein